MNKKVIVFALGAIVMFGSCASKKELQACQTENKELGQKYVDVKEQLAAANARLAALQDQLNQKTADMMHLQASLDKSLTNASQNNISIEKLVDQINESNQYIRHLVEVKSKSDSLNMVLTNNLTRSLSREEMKEVDVQVLKGVVYISLADNMLYKSGSYEINDRAAETLSKIAKIIKDYKDYDVLIEGNTDNVPVNTTAATMKNIRNNWDLSCLRASSVVQYLQNINAPFADKLLASVQEQQAQLEQMYQQQQQLAIAQGGGQIENGVVQGANQETVNQAQEYLQSA